MADWYYTKNGQQQGPVTSAQLRQLAQSGELQPTDMVFKEGGAQWVAASTIANLFSSSGVSSRPGPPSRSGRDEDDRDDRGRDRDRGEGSLDFDDDDDRPIRRKSKAGGGGGILGYLLFGNLIGIPLIALAFWLEVIGFTCYMLYQVGELFFGSISSFVPFSAKLKAFGYTMGIILVNAVLMRLYGEALAALAHTSNSLRDIKELLKKQQRDKP